MTKFINEIEGIVCWPKKRSDKQFVIEWLSSKFQFEKKYSEKEVNNIIEAYHSFNDIALLRRELISKRLLKRKDDGSKYWKTNSLFLNLLLLQNLILSFRTFAIFVS